MEDNKIKLFKINNNNKVECKINEKYVLINISNNNKINYKYILEICTLNENNIIKPIYLLCYFNDYDFSQHINYVLSFLDISFGNFLESLSFSHGKGIELYNKSNKEVGIIFKLPEECLNRIKISENNMKNDINIGNNINLNNNINPNINISISNNPLMISNPTNYIFSNIQPQIKINNIQNIRNIKSIDEEFQQSPQVGLKNIGANCYMNATLQCLCNIKEFVNFFKYELKDEEINKYKYVNKAHLTISFKYLIENLWPSKDNNNYINLEYNYQKSNNGYYNPFLFLENITNMNPFLKNTQVTDALDLINYLLMTLHEELNIAPKKGVINSQNLYPNQNSIEYIKFKENFENENKSLIIDLFNGIYYNETKCSYCNFMKYNFSHSFYLYFDLGKVMNYKIHKENQESNQFNQNFLNEMNNLINSQQNFKIYSCNIENINSVNLDVCLRYMYNSVELEGQYIKNCDCNSALPSISHKMFYIGPKILILILSNGNNMESKYKCEFVPQLNLYEFIENKNVGYIYDLISMVSYKEEIGTSGYFIAYCKSPIDDVWYEYNDEFVYPVINVQEAFNNAIPHILFYKKMN